MKYELSETLRSDSIPIRRTVEDFDGSVDIWIFPRAGPRSVILGVTADSVSPVEGFGSVTIEGFSESAEPEEVEEEFVELRKIPRKEAINLVKSYIDSYPGCLTSDIIFELALDPALVLSVLKELEERHEIRGRDIE